MPVFDVVNAWGGWGTYDPLPQSCNNNSDHRRQWDTVQILWQCRGSQLGLSLGLTLSWREPPCPELPSSLRAAHIQGLVDAGVWRPVIMHAQSCLTLRNLMDCGPPSSSVHAIFPARIPHGLPFPPPGNLPDPGIELASLASPHWQADSLPLSH